MHCRTFHETLPRGGVSKVALLYTRAPQSDGKFTKQLGGAPPNGPILGIGFREDT